MAGLLIILGLLRRKQLFNKDHIILISGGMITLVLGFSGFSIELLAQILFSIISALSLVVCIAMFYRFSLITTSTGVLHTGLYLLLNFISTALLGLLTGENAEGFAILRPYIIISWLLTSVLLAISLQHQLIIINTIVENFKKEA